MEENKDLDRLINKTIKSMDLENPSVDFTINVLLKTNAIKNSKSVVYKPLISKKLLIGLSITFIGVIIYFGLFGKSNTNLLSDVNFTLPKMSIPQIQLNSIVFNAILILGFGFLLQIPLLKSFNDKQKLT